MSQVFRNAHGWSHEIHVGGASMDTKASNKSPFLRARGRGDDDPKTFESFVILTTRKLKKKK